jgi:nucleotide-binding universal stress UspA family protein
MAKSILVPLDGSLTAEYIFPEVTRILPAKGTVHLAQFHSSDSSESRIEYLDRIRRTHFPGHAGTDFVGHGRPAEGILRLALKKNIDLIAMTTHARKGIPRRLLGSVAAEVVAKSQLPVLLTRPNTPTPAEVIQRILVPVEGNELPSALLSTLKTLTPARKPEIILFRVLPPLHDPAPQWALEFSLAPDKTPERRLQELADVLAEAGFQAWPLTCVGKPAEEILFHATNLDVDLIAMSAHCRSGLERVFEGSVSEQVLRRSRVGVLLQRPVIIHKPILTGATHD